MNIFKILPTAHSESEPLTILELLEIENFLRNIIKYFVFVILQFVKAH